MTVAWIALICGIWWTFLSLITQTKNFMSSLLFRVIPFFSGLASLLVAAKLFGIINF